MGKILLIISILLFSPAGAWAFTPALGAGTQEVSIRGHWDPEGPMGSEFDVSGRYGIFLADYFLVGGLAGYAYYEDAVTGMDADSRLWMMGGFVEYHADLGMLTVPYGGIELGFASFEMHGAPRESSFFYGPKIGMKYFLSEKVALDMALHYTMATDEIFMRKGELKDNDLFVTFGGRALF